MMNNLKAGLVLALNVLPLTAIKGALTALEVEGEVLDRISFHQEEAARLVAHLRKGGSSWAFQTDVEKMARIGMLPDYLVPEMKRYQERMAEMGRLPTAKEHIGMIHKVFWEAVDHEMDEAEKASIIDSAAYAMMDEPLVQKAADRILS